MTNEKKYISLPEVRQKIRNYCTYQERCHKEVSDKLRGFGLHEDQIGEVIVNLIAENYLNEERYVEAFVVGKFRQKKWGKYKIRQKLKEKRINSKMIDKGLLLIPDDEYIATIQQLVEMKYNKLKERASYKKNAKVAQYVVNKGFESDLVWEAVKEMFE